MTSRQVFELLGKIGNGYEPSEEEKSELSNKRAINWHGFFLGRLPESIENLTHLQSFDLSNTQISEIPESIGNLTSLKSLDLSNTQINELPASIENLANLQILNLSNSKISKLPESIVNLKNLQYLNLQNTRISNVPENIGNLTSLQSFDLSFTKINEVPNSVGSLTSLQSFVLRSTQISELPENIGNLVSLMSLDLGLTKISNLPESIVNLKNLYRLDLRGSKISVLPKALGDLPALQFLILTNLELDELPESLLNLNLDYKNTNFNYITGRGIYIKGLKLLNQPIEVFSQSRELIIEYYRSTRGELTIPINECKVVFLGDGGAGKSLIIDRLMNDGTISAEFKGESTPGICISSKKYQIGDEEIELHFWDFGGQAIMHSMHRLFLTNRTLYVIVANARDNKANEQAWYWIRNIKSFANNAPVLLLVNQKDQNPSANVNVNGLRKEYAELKDVRVVSALKDSKEEFDREIRDVICQIVSGMETVHTPFSHAWLSLMNDLQDMKEDYITSDVFYTKCTKNHVDNESDILDQIIAWYQDLGVCFYSRKHPASRRYMVLKPRWLLNAIYILAFNGRKYAENGILKEEDIYKLISKPVADSDVKKVYPDIKYKEHEIQYIVNVLLNFNLVHRIDNERFFVPMLCDENEPDIIDEFDSEDAIHVSFKYDYLPENVIHRLMVKHGDELNTGVVWKTGALFEHRRCSWQALVRSKDDCLDIYAKAGDQETHPISSYLDIIRESVYGINVEIGLEAEEFITYFKDGKKEDFEYLLLEEMRNNGLKEIYSRVFHSQLSINDIIGAIRSPDQLMRGDADGQMQEVLSNLKDALLKLQKNRSNYGKTENECNSYIRDLMETSGYICKDQTLQGVSENRKGDGELDFLIRGKDSGDDITIYEALKLDQKTFAKSDQNYLSAHLLKLLDNYNPNGLKNLLLVSYVSWGKEQFNALAAKYKNYISKNVADPYEIIDCRTMDHLSTAFIRCYLVRYDCGGISMYVYHFVVRVAG